MIGVRNSGADENRTETTMFNVKTTKATAAALALATAVTFATAGNADAGRRHYGGNAAGAAFAVAATGLLIGAIAAHEHRRRERAYYYGYGPRYGYYGPRYGYYAPRPYYGPRYGYYGPHRHYGWR
jgi:hypothetical protein